MVDTSPEAVERLAREIAALASREAQTMPSGWADAYELYSGAAATLRAQAARIATLDAVLAGAEYRNMDDITTPEHGFRLGQEVAAMTKDYINRTKRAEAELAEMTRRRDEWRAKAEGYDAVRLALREKVGTPWPPHLSRAMWAGVAADEKKRADDAEAAIKSALALLDASLFTNAEHQRAKDVLRAALQEDQ